MNLYIKIWEILDNTYKKRALVLLLLMLVGVFLETLSIGLIIPLVSLILDSQNNLSHQFIENLMNIIGLDNKESLLIFGILIFFIAFLVKIIFLILISYKQNKFTYELQAKLAHKLFLNYLKKNYDFHLKNNSSELIRNIASEVNLFCSNVLLATAVLTLECLVSISLLIFLIIFEPLGAFFIFILFVMSGLIFLFFLKKRLQNLGENRQILAKYNLQSLMQGFEGIKEIKFLNIENKFSDYFKKTIFETSKVNYIYGTIMSLPRFSLELLTVCSISILILTLKIQALPNDVIIGVVAVFGAATFRILPSATRIMGAIQNIKYGKPTLKILKDQLKIVTNETNERNEINLDKNELKFDKKITIQNVSFYYDEKIKILNDINFEFFKKDKIGIIGSTGSGKSTFIDLLTGLLRIKSGDIKVDNKSIFNNLKKWQQKIGYISQSIFLLDDTLENNIVFGSEKKLDRDLITKVIKLSKLDKLVAELPDGLNTLVGERGSRISGGQKQRIGIARALYREAEILILDEATSALDYETETSIMKMINDEYKDKTLIIVSHRENTLKVCNKIFKIKNGVLINQ